MFTIEELKYIIELCRGYIDYCNLYGLDDKSHKCYEFMYQLEELIAVEESLTD